MKKNNLTYDKMKFEYNKEIKQLYWDMAIGLNQVDNLTPSNYLLELSKENIEGKINNEEVVEKLYEHYQKQENAPKRVSEKEECDMVSVRIVSLLEDKSFSFSPITLLGIHGNIFKDIYDFAGKYRDYNITKKEAILNGDTVNYANFDFIEKTLDYDFKEEREFNYNNISKEDFIKRTAQFTSRIWQVHPFGEGNTRTIAVFMIKYLNSKGYNINNDLFKEYSKYFRNALVRANYTNSNIELTANDSYLIKFFKKLLTDNEIILENKELIVNKLFEGNNY